MAEEKKKSSVWMKVLGVGMAACLIGNLGLAVYQIQSSSVSDKKVSKFIDKELKRQAEESKKENEYQEDGYKVDDTYEIKSTTAISDAYLSGDDSKLSKEEKETLDMATKILEKVTKDCKTDYEKEIAVYDWMYKNIRGGHSSSVTLPTTDVSDNYTPHGVLAGKDAVCVGYATTFRMFMQMMEIDCHIVHNDYHSWDLVQLDDDQWYHVDIYSDVASNSQYQNFNMSDGVARNMGHEWSASSLPSAEGSEYSYPVQNAVEIKDIYSIPKQIKKAIKKKKSGLYYSFKNKISDEDMELANVLLDSMNTVFYGPKYDGNMDISASWYDDGENGYVLGIFFSYYGMQDEYDTPGEDSNAAKKLKKTIEEVFDVDLEALSNGEYGE